jgi:hypothetical protein
MNEEGEDFEDDDEDDQLPLDLTFSQVDEICAKHSGQYIAQRNPQLYESIKLMLEWGVPKKTIAKRCRVSKNAVIAIARLEEPDTVEHHKKVMIHGLRSLSRGAMELLIEKIESGSDISPRDLAVILGISTEKHELLTGGATSRVERTVDPELAAFYQALLKPTGSQMVLEAETSPPNGEPFPALPGLTSGQTGDNLSPANES